MLINVSYLFGYSREEKYSPIREIFKIKFNQGTGWAFG